MIRLIYTLYLVYLIFISTSCLNKEKAIPEPIASFEYEFLKNGEVRFINNSKNAETYVWEFGNNKKSELKNPVVTFTNNEKYSIKLKAINNDRYDEYVSDIIVSTVNDTLELQSSMMYGFYSSNNKDINVIKITESKENLSATGNFLYEQNQGGNFNLKFEPKVEDLNLIVYFPGAYSQINSKKTIHGILNKIDKTELFSIGEKKIRFLKINFDKNTINISHYFGKNDSWEKRYIQLNSSVSGNLVSGNPFSTSCNCINYNSSKFIIK